MRQTKLQPYWFQKLSNLCKFKNELLAECHEWFNKLLLQLTIVMEVGYSDLLAILTSYKVPLHKVK